MKKLLTSFVIISILGSIACRPPQKSNALADRAMDTIENYLSKTLSDPKNYQSVSFSQLIPIYNNTSFQRFDTAQRKINGYAIMHSYKAMNRYGKLQFYNQKFILDSTLRFVQSIDQNNE